MNRAKRARSACAVLAGLTLTLLASRPYVHPVLAQAAATPTADSKQVAEPVKDIDPVAVCNGFITAELSGKPLENSELAADLQDTMRSQIDRSALCKATKIVSPKPCEALPAARQQACLAKAREAVLRAWRSDDKLCESDLPGADCTALRRAVADADPESCTAIKAPEWKRCCMAWALGDPAQCQAEDRPECAGLASLLGKTSKAEREVPPPSEPMGLPIGSSSLSEQAKFARQRFAPKVNEICELQSFSKAECQALERAVGDADAKQCSAMKSRQWVQTCKAWALGDPAQCAQAKADLPEPEKQRAAECAAAAQHLGKVDKEGLAALPVPDEASREVLEIATGSSKGSCDEVLDAVKADCVAQTKKAFAAAAAVAEDRRKATANAAAPAPTAPAADAGGGTPPPGEKPEAAKPAP